MSEFDKLNLNPKKILKILILIIVILLVCHIIGVSHKKLVGHGFLTITFEPLFNLDLEGTVPSYISSLLLLAASIILGLIAFDTSEKLNRKHWFLLSLLFIYLSFDEFCEFHEIFEIIARNRIDVEDWLYKIFAFIPFFFLLALFPSTFINFIISLPNKIKFNFGISAIIFFLGAIGMETLGAIYKGTLYYQVFMPVEEVLEMTGVSFFIYSLLQYKEEFGSSVIISIKSI